MLAGSSSLSAWGTEMGQQGDDGLNRLSGENISQVIDSNR